GSPQRNRRRASVAGDLVFSYSSSPLFGQQFQWDDYTLNPEKTHDICAFFNNLIDLNKAIENTITVARNEWKYIAEMVTDFDPGLPLVPCLPAEINQVILNLIINASHAVADTLEQNGSDQKGTITIATRALIEYAEIRISDTGTGIPENIRSKIFDPFFTTKEVGKGTGQGLAISHSVVVDKHGGTITFDSEVGKGASFVIRLPFNQNGSEK